jgi:hypothetical protein
LDEFERSWAESRTQCTSSRVERDFHLVTLHSVPESEMAYSVAIPRSSTGGRSRPEAWVTGEAGSVSLYADGEPNGVANQCIRFANSPPGRLDDDDCGTAYGALCEDELWPTW